MNAENKNPSLDQFLSTTRREFAFLVEEFGFIEHPDKSKYPNPFSVHYISATTTVAVDGINWGFGVQILLSCRLKPTAAGRRAPLWAIVRLRAPHEPEPISAQLQNLARDAVLLRSYAADVLRGDFTCFPAANAIVNQNAVERAKPKQRKLP